MSPADDADPNELSVADLSTDEYYTVTYRATRAAIWDVLGDVTLTLVLAVICLIGLQLTVASAFSMSSIVPLAIGFVVIFVSGGGILYLHGVWPYD